MEQALEALQEYIDKSIATVDARQQALIAIAALKEAIKQQEKDSRADYCGSCGQWTGGPVICCHESERNSKPMITKAEAKVLREAIKPQGKMATAPMKPCLNAVMLFPQGSLKREMLDESGEWFSAAGCALIGDLWRVFHSTSAPTIPEGWREFIEAVSEQKPEKPDYWSTCMQCESNIRDAEDLLSTAPKGENE
jgi:hypothetical protein